MHMQQCMHLFFSNSCWFIFNVLDVFVLIFQFKFAFLLFNFDFKIISVHKRFVFCFDCFNCIFPFCFSQISARCLLVFSVLHCTGTPFLFLEQSFFTFSAMFCIVTSFPRLCFCSFTFFDNALSGILLVD